MIYYESVLIENPEVVAFAIGALSSILFFHVFKRMRVMGENRGVMVLASLAIGLIIGYNLLRYEFFGFGDYVIAIAFYIIVAGVFFIVLKSFFKYFIRSRL